MSVPVTELRRRLLAVEQAHAQLQWSMLKQWALPHEDGHLVMDFENVEDMLRTMRARIDDALLQVAVVVALAGDMDSRYWAEAQGLAA